MANGTDDKEPLFLPAPFFMVRTPVLPIEDFFRLTAHDDIKKMYKTNPLIQEAIAVASPSLHTALEKGKWDNDQLSSLLRYLLRMSTRPTPFGLFAFVSHGYFAEKASIIFDSKKIKKRARPDMEWLFTVIDQVSSNDSLFSQLPIRSNPLVFTLGERVFLNYVRKKENEKTNKTFSIRSNFLINDLFEIARTPLRIEQLQDKIIEKHPTLDRIKIRSMIKSLIEQQFLLLDLYPTLLTTSPFEDIIAKTICLPNSSPPLQELCSKINSYNQTRLGEGSAILKTLENEMKQTATSTNLLQVDCAYENCQLTLPRIVAKELQEAVEVLWKLSGKKEASHLHSYHNKFLDKYGVERRVPVKELLNEDVGLGLPEGYADSYLTREEIDEKEKKWKKWLKREWTLSLQEKQKEILLTDEILNRNLTQAEKEKAQLSFDLFCEIFANSPEEVDNGNFLIYVSTTTHQAGSTFGRFLDLFEKNNLESMKQLLLKEESLEQNALFTESSYLPLSARSANVATHPNLRQHKIDLSTGEEAEGSISIDDIYVGANVDRLYLISKKKNRELILRTGNVLNPTHAPVILRFLRDVSNTKYLSLQPFFWSDLNDALFLPRIRYKNIIFSPAQWKVDLSLLNAKEKDSEAMIEKKFLAWASKWELPRYIFMTVGDNRILLDRHCATHLNQITVRLKKNEEITLVEKIGQQEGQWVKTQRGSHLSEFVIPFIKNNKYIPSPSVVFPFQLSSIETKDRWKLPGSEWLFAKFYLGKESENRFLVNHLLPFTHFLKQQNIVLEWFFIRYKDPDSHFRVRFRGEPGKIITQLLPALHDWASHLLYTHQIKNVALNSYEREVERYGGKELIPVAENFFCADSEVAINLVQLIVEKKLTLPVHVIAALSLLDMMNGFGLTLQEQLNHFNFKDEDKSELKGFREWKSDLVSLAMANLDNAWDGQKKKEGLMLSEAWQKRKDALTQYVSKMTQLLKEGSLTTPVQGIQNSLMHMHCNRFMGADLQLEKKARLYASNTLITLLQRKV